MPKIVWADHHREALNPKHWQGFLPDHILKAWPKDKYLMVLCIGIVHSTGDSLGPLVGTELLKRKVLDVNTTGVCGSLAESVHLLNVLDTWRDIQQNYANFWTLVVDSALTQEVGLDNLQFGVGPSHPASGAGHNLPGVGDAVLMGCVGMLSMPRLMHSVSLYKVHCLADAIVETILAISRARAAGSETAVPYLPAAPHTQSAGPVVAGGGSSATDAPPTTDATAPTPLRIPATAPQPTAERGEVYRMPEDEKTFADSRFVAEHRHWLGSRGEEVHALSIGVARTRADGAGYVHGWHVTPGQAVRAVEFLRDNIDAIMQEAIKVDAMELVPKGTTKSAGLTEEDVARIVAEQVALALAARRASGGT